MLTVQVTSGQSFVHPGLLHSKEDLSRMRQAVMNKEEPIYSGYQIFIQNPVSQYNYKMQGPLEMVGRNPTVGQGIYDSDANAAHQNAVMWAITGDTAYAEKAKQIVNAWSSTLKSITGRDAVLMAGLGPFKMLNAAEILRYTYAGWSASDISKTEKHFKEVVYPVIKDFAPFANGNWDAAAIKTVLAISVFCNDRPMFEKALQYYVNGQGNGRLTNYVINEQGQIQESGRDQGHTQLGIGMLAESCEIAWHQGLNLYGYADNRLLKGFEYVASFNLGNEVPFGEWLDRTGKYHHKTIARQDRGPLRALYEQVYNHYVNRIGLTASFTQQAAEKIRPEGPGRPGADHPGYGTLYFTKPNQSSFVSSTTVPVPPAAIVATNSSIGNQLSWIASIVATNYTVKRAIKNGGPYTVIAKNVRQSNYTDKNVEAGRLYYYTVSALNEKGESPNAYQTAITTGMPFGWKQQDIGNSKIKGTTSFDGKSFTIEGAGIGVDSISDEIYFDYSYLIEDGEIIARFVPQPSSQFSEMGLMIRETTAPNSSFVALLIYPGKTGQIESPDWHIRLLTRNTAGEKSKIISANNSLSEKAVSWGRLTGFVWLRLKRKGDDFTASVSYDGNSWTSIGTVSVQLQKNVLAGLLIASGMTNSTTIKFDNVVIVPQKK
jgi:hypothetical protein